MGDKFVKLNEECTRLDGSFDGINWYVIFDNLVKGGVTEIMKPETHTYTWSEDEKGISDFMCDGKPADPKIMDKKT